MSKFQLGFAIILGLGISFFCIIFYIGYQNNINSPAYVKATEYLKQDDEIRKLTGGVEGFGFATSSKTSIYTSGIGCKAYYSLSVKGVESNISVKINLETDSSKQWKVVQCIPKF